MRSLRARLSTGSIAALVVLLGLLLALISYSLRHLIEVFVAERLEHELDTLLTLLAFDDQGRLQLDQEHLPAIYRQPYSGHYFKIVAGETVLRSRSLWDTDLDLPQTTNTAVSRVFRRGPQAQQLLLVAREFRLQGRRIRIGATEDFTPLAEGFRRLALNLALFAVLSLGPLVLVQDGTVRRGLQPLNAIREEILRLTRGEIRTLQPDAPQELQPLVTEINRLIELMDQRLQRSRRSLGNLAHALKTPLTVLLQLAEQQPQALRAEWEQQIGQIRGLMDRELKRARIAGGGAPGQQVVLHQEVMDLVVTLKKIYRARALRFDCHIPADSAFAGDRDDILELLGNLLDNACQWAHSLVRLDVRQEEHRLHLRVEDDGPGCPPEQLVQLTQRGARIDEARSGHGLGLAIVADIVEQYEGVLSLGRSRQYGGFSACVELPL